MSYIFALFIFAPLLVYLIPILRGLRYEHRAARFFFAQQQISPTAFANSSVAYGFQIASVSVFFGWGFEYGFGALINPLFWGIGILWFLSFLPKYSFFLGRAQTLHGLLGETYCSPNLTKLAAVMTICGFVGALTAELAWGSTIVSLISANPYFIAAITTFMALSALFYVLWAGQESIVLADQYRLAVAHVGFASLLFFVVMLLHWQNAETQAIGIVLSGVMIFLFGIIVWTTNRQVRNSVGEDNSNMLSVRCTRFIRNFMLVGVFGAAVNLIFFWLHANQSTTAVVKTSLINFGQGPINLLSLALLPLCWQFIDFTMWQRLSGVRFESAADLKRIRFSILRYAIETPVSWIFALTAGVALRYGILPLDSVAIQTGISSIPIALAQTTTPMGQAVDAIVAGVFGAGVVAAMLSTVDTFIIAATSAFVYDLTPSATASTNRSSFKMDTAIQEGKIVAVGLVVIGLISYYIASYFSFDLVSLLFGAYSSQLSLLPAVLGALYLRGHGPSSTIAIASVFLGFLGGIGATVIALVDSTWSLYPPLFSLGISSLVYIAGWQIRGLKTK
jgi:Na+/pantothenate symporter